jgi:hypothetical protein
MFTLFCFLAQGDTVTSVIGAPVAGDLFEAYADAIRNLPSRDLDVDDLRCERFRLQAEKRIDVYYTPFDYVNEAARVSLVGITPGWHQMRAAYMTARALLQSGMPHREVLAGVSSAAGFSGPMRTNLVRMLDGLSLPQLLGIATSADLFGSSRHLRHGTSAIRYAAFIAGRNYTGSSPALTTVPLFRRYVFDVLAPELARVRGSIVIPMGRAVESALQLLIDARHLSAERCCLGFPHPSGGNGYRIRHYAEAQAEMRRTLADWFAGGH